MRNPRYEEDLHGVTIGGVACIGEACPVLSWGIKTMTHNRDGLKLHAHRVIALEMREGGDLDSFDLTASLARHLSHDLARLADIIESDSVVQHGKAS